MMMMMLYCYPILSGDKEEEDEEEVHCIKGKNWSLKCRELLPGSCPKIGLFFKSVCSDS